MALFSNGGGPFGGASAPIPIAGVAGRFLPHWATRNAGANITGVATRLYYIPYFFPAIVQYTGLAFSNTSAAENGETWRGGVYQASASTGLPSTLVADCGQGTLTAAASERLLATAWTPPYVGWGFLAMHLNSESFWAAMSSLDSGSTAVGIMASTPAMRMFGQASLLTATETQTFGCYYVDTAYAALAATAVAPTGILAAAPIVAPYRT